MVVVKMFRLEKMVQWLATIQTAIMMFCQRESTIFRQCVFKLYEAYVIEGH